MDIFQTLPSLKDTDAAEEAEQPKQVGPRNGPVRYRDVSNGQMKRARTRALAKQTRRARRGQVKTHLEQQRELAILRSSLQAVGVVPYTVESIRPTEDQIMSAIRVLVERYGSVDGAINDETLRDALEVAYKRYQVLMGA